MPILKTDPDVKHIHLMCSPERETLYRELVSPVALELRVSANPNDAYKAVVSDPGKAILVDMPTALHAGVSETGRLFDLGIAMPILRCSHAEDGAWTAMCQAPFKRLPLPLALREIADGSDSWKHPKFVRRYVRIPFRSRVRFRKIGDSPWLLGNVQNACAGGLFLLTMHVEEIGARLELELVDVGNGVTMTGSVVWRHLWDEGPSFPGMGLQLDSGAIPPKFRLGLAESSTVH